MNGFGTRPALRRWIAWRAQRRRARGRYDRDTLRLFQRAARLGGAAARLDYLLFRRDLGYPLNKRLAARLLGERDRLPARKQWLADALLAERDFAPPTVADPGPGLMIAAEHQEDWREGLQLALHQAAHANGICLVGNAGALAGTGLGTAIDAASLVIRFNAFGRNERTVADVGRRTTVWVTNPSYDGPRFDEADWVVISGPDVCYRLRDWSDFASRLRRARPVLTVPLPVWRELVRVLRAPPSAGVLMLAWLHDLLGSWQGISAAGIGAGTGGPYHLNRIYRGSSRHNWAGEAALVQRWVEHGLTRLPVAPSRRSVPELVESLS